MLLLHGFVYIWNKLKQNFKYMAPRGFNQDPVEIFFSCIRSHGVGNTRPTCSSFISSYKALLVNNLVSPHSAAALALHQGSARLSFGAL
jgi:hypothetical protein